MKRLAIISLFALTLTGLSAPVAHAAGMEGVGSEMGYRIWGDAKKNKPVLVQNSRSKAIEIFDESKGVFMPVDSYSDAEFDCRGLERRFNVRFKDSFRESVPFQVQISCGQELQLIDPAKFAAPQAQPRQQSPQTASLPDSIPDTGPQPGTFE